MARMLVVDAEGVVINVVVVEGSSWTPPQGTRIEDAVAGVGIGWRWDGSQWTAPAAEPVVAE